MNITYYASNDSMGDTSERDCELFRAWAAKEIKAEYPEHNVTVSGEQSLVTAETDDDRNEDEIIDFCSRLWDSCPWDWAA